MRWLIGAALAAMVLAGCAGHEEPREAAPPTSDPTTSVTTSPPTITQAVVVPDVWGLHRAAARRTLKDLGLRARTSQGGQTACPPHDWVVGQSPRAGARVNAGRRVDLYVVVQSPGECGLGLPPAGAQQAALGRAFVAFARGRGPAPPTSQRVTLLVGNQPLRTISGQAARSRASLAGCPPKGGYAGRICPFSAARPFRRDYLGPIAITSAAPSHNCAHPAPLPPRLRVLEFVTLTPDESLDCTAYFAVRLFVDDGRIVAANVVWAEP